MAAIIPEMTLDEQIAAATACGSRASEEKLLMLALSVLSIWKENGVPIISNPGTETPSISIETENGSVASGAKSVSFTTSDDFVGTISGVAIPAGVSFGFSAQNGNTLSSINYTISSGNIIIAKTV